MRLTCFGAMLMLVACRRSSGSAPQLDELANVGEGVASQMLASQDKPSDTLEACRGKFPGRIAYYQAKATPKGVSSPGPRLFARDPEMANMQVDYTPGNQSERTYFDPSVLGGLAVGVIIENQDPVDLGDSLKPGTAKARIRVISLPAKQTLCEGIVEINLSSVSVGANAVNDVLRKWDAERLDVPWSELCRVGAPGTCYMQR